MVEDELCKTSKNLVRKPSARAMLGLCDCRGGAVIGLMMRAVLGSMGAIVGSMMKAVLGSIGVVIGSMM
jgi:hypothetical protein